MQDISVAHLYFIMFQGVSYLENPKGPLWRL